MKWFRYFTWYYRFHMRWKLYAMERRANVGTAQLLTAVFFMVVPGIAGAMLFALLYVTGLIRLFPEMFLRFLTADGTGMLQQGATIFSLVAIVAALFYWIIGSLCLMPDALRPPNYQNKKHLWKDWPSD